MRTDAESERWVALVVLCTGMLMIVLDMTIVNVALPSIQAHLGFSRSGLAWVVNAYLIAFAGLLLLAWPARRPRPAAGMASWPAWRVLTGSSQSRVWSPSRCSARR